MQVNQKVIGNYMGANIEGHITEKRMLTVKTDGCFEYHIQLDKKVNVFGADRDHVLIYAKFNGEPSSYTKHTDWLKAA
jgi:hypothetical protein